MDFYLILFIICLELIFLGSYTKNLYFRFFFIFISYVLLIYFSSIRCNVGIDYQGHKLIYNEISVRNYLPYVYEPVYLLLNIICVKLNLGFQGVIILMSLITSIPIYIISNKKNAIFTFSLFFLNYYIYSYCLIRQYAAISLAVLAMYLYFQEKRKKAFIFFLFAVGIHVSCICFVLSFYLSLYIKMNKYFVVFLIAFLYLLILKTNLIDKFLYFVLSKTKYSVYALNGLQKQAKGSGLGVLLKLCIYSAFFILVNFSQKSITQTNRFFFNTFFIFFMGSFFLGVKWLPLSRLHFSFLPLLFVPCFFMGRGNRRKTVNLSNCILFFIVLAYLIFFPGTLSDWGDVPYQSIFNN